jgi:hypothetical protein
MITQLIEMVDHEDEEECHAAEEVLERVSASPANELNIRHQTADNGQQTADSRKQTADSRQQTADSRQQTADNLQQL